jgi:UPF0716 protein FxsA
MRRFLPWWVLALLFVGLPVLEIWLIVQLGQAVGPWWTILVIVGAGVLGAWLIKREGARAWRALTEALRAGRVPSRELADGALILVGGSLLLTPGFVTDVVGLVCVLPFTRPVPRRLLTGLISRRLVLVGPTGPGRQQRGGPAGRPGGQQPGAEGRDDDAPPDPGVVRGDVIE